MELAEETPSGTSPTGHSYFWLGKVSFLQKLPVSSSMLVWGCLLGQWVSDSHRWLWMQALLQRLQGPKLNIALRGKKGSLRFQWVARVMRGLNYCDALQRQYGHKLEGDLNHIQSQHKSVTPNNLLARSATALELWTSIMTLWGCFWRRLRNHPDVTN